MVVSQKIVSKAEGRVLSISSAIPGAEARKLAAVLGKDPALVELILAESREVLRAEGGVLITETHHGFVCANAGVDTSNLPDPDTACLLPEDPDASARRIRAEITAAVEAAVPVAVIVSDSFGRAWRLGQAEVAIGCAGHLPPRRLARTRRRRRPRARGDGDRDRRRGRGGGRPGPRQDERRARGDRPRPRRGTSPRRTGPGRRRCAGPATRTSSASGTAFAAG